MKESPAIVLKKMDGRGSDQILSLLTKESGKITAVARGAKRSKKRFFGGIDLFNCGIFEFAPTKGNNKGGSDIRVISGLRSRTNWDELRENLASFLLASSVVETVQIFARADDPEGAKLFSLVYLSLNNLSHPGNDTIKFAAAIYYYLNLLEQSGFSLLAEAEHLPDVEVRWFKEMLERKTAFVPESPDLIRDALLILTERIQDIAEYPINSFEQVLLKAQKI